MKSQRRKAVATLGGAAVVATIAALVPLGGAALAAQPAPRNQSVQQPVQVQQSLQAHAISAKLPSSQDQAGRWIDPDGRLTVAVTNAREADRVRQSGATPKLVARSQAQLDDLLAKVDKIARADRGKGLQSWGIDPVSNKVVVRARGAYGAVRGLGDGVQVVQVTTDHRQQSGEVNPGDPWWPGSESNCSVGFPATDAQGGKHFLTAGHCTNDANQAAYGASGQSNKIGTSNVGGTHSVNAREGDMGLVDVTESGWTISPNVNTWGQPAVTVSGSADAIVGDPVCHSGNTAPNWECGTVTAVNQSIDYGNVVIDGLSTTNACSEGGDSGGAWVSGTKAVGLHSGGNSSCVTGDSGNSIFQPIKEALTKWNLTLLIGDGGPGDPGDDEAPTTPGNPRSTGTTTDSVSLAWDASTDNIGVSGYDVYNGTTLATTVTGTSATVGGLAADTSYSFTVQAKDAAGNKSKAEPGGDGPDPAWWHPRRAHLQQRHGLPDPGLPDRGQPDQVDRDRPGRQPASRLLSRAITPAWRTSTSAWSPRPAAGTTCSGTAAAPATRCRPARPTASPRPVPRTPPAPGPCASATTAQATPAP